MPDLLQNLSRWLSSGPSARCRPARRLHFEALEPRRLLDGAGGLLGFSAEGESSPAPEFALPDVNATSSSHNQLVSPRDYLQQVSAWYFGQST